MCGSSCFGHWETWPICGEVNLTPSAEQVLSFSFSCLYSVLLSSNSCNHANSSSLTALSLSYFSCAPPSVCTFTAARAPPFSIAALTLSAIAICAVCLSWCAAAADFWLLGFGSFLSAHQSSVPGAGEFTLRLLFHLQLPLSLC